MKRKTLFWGICNCHRAKQLHRLRDSHDWFVMCSIFIRTYAKIIFSFVSSFQFYPFSSRWPKINTDKGNKPLARVRIDVRMYLVLNVMVLSLTRKLKGLFVEI